MQYRVQVDNNEEISIDSSQTSNLDYVQTSPYRYHFLIETQGYNVEVLTLNPIAKSLVLIVNGRRHSVIIRDEMDLLLDRLGFSKEINRFVDKLESPMTGLVLSVDVETGEEVNEGDRLIILEAMKMENIIKSPVTGIIKEILVTTGQNIDKGQVLIRFEK